MRLQRGTKFENSGDNTVADLYGIEKFTVKDLKVELKYRGVLVTELAPILKEQFVKYMIKNSSVRDYTVEDDGLAKWWCK